MRHDMKIIYTVPQVMKHWLLATVLLLLFSISVAMAWQAEPSAPHPPIHLTREERAWLDGNHTVRVRIFDWPPTLVGKETAWSALIDSEDYTFANVLGGYLYDQGQNGLLARSARCNGTNAAILRQSVLSDVV